MAADKLRERKDLRNATTAAAASTNESSNDSYAMMERHSFLGDSDNWFVDSGATDYMCCNKDSFTVYHSLKHPKPIYLSDSTVVNANGMATIRIGDKVNLFHVLQFHDIDINLLSIDKVLQQNYDVSFYSIDCTIKQGKNNIVEAFRVGRLFRVNGKARKQTILYSNALSRPVRVTPQHADSPPDLPGSPQPPVGAQPLVLRHQRIGHLHYYDLRSLFSVVNGSPMTDSQKLVDLGVCPPCLMGKHQKT